MIGFVVRELTFLKVLYPIIKEFIRNGVPYILYHMDCDRGYKNYNRATLINLKKSSETIVSKATKVKAFTNDKQLLAQLIHDKITKLVSIEIWLWAKGYLKELKKHKIKTYSILYANDSIWEKDAACITSMDKVYYASKHTMNIHHDFAGIKHNRHRDQCIGSPVFDPILNKPPEEGKDILVLLPNIRVEHVPVSFGSAANFFKIIEKLSKGGNLIFKTRKKQWLPEEIKKYANEIVEDGDKMYPPVLAGLLKRCYMTVLFYSSGIYEVVYGGNYVLNIKLPLKRWGWESSKLKEYLKEDGHSLYDFKGVVESIDQKTILQDDWEFKPRLIDPIHRRWWVEKFIGPEPCGGAKSIALNIICDG